MARFYSTFSGTALSPTAGTIAEDVAYKRYTFVAMGGSPSTLKSNIQTSRDALSTAVLGQLDVANRVGSVGTVIPDFTISGGSLSWSNVYYNAGAQPNADQSVRPFSTVVPYAGITAANSTAASPADPGSITDTLYTTAQSDVMAAVNAITTSPYARLGNYPLNTLASIFIDSDVTYVAWDDFTPGKPQSLSAQMLQNGNPITEPINATGNITARLSWTPQYISDKNGAVYVSAAFYSANETLYLGGTNSYVNLGEGIVSYDWIIDTTQFDIDSPTENFSIQFSVQYADYSITQSFGLESDLYTDVNVVTFIGAEVTTTTTEGTTTTTTAATTTTTTAATTTTTTAAPVTGTCYEVSLTGGSNFEINWTDITDGETSQIVFSGTTIYLCSLTIPTWSGDPQTNGTITSCGVSCDEFTDCEQSCGEGPGEG